MTAREPLDNGWNSQKQTTKNIGVSSLPAIDTEIEKLAEEWKLYHNTINAVDVSTAGARQQDVVIFDKRSGNQKVVSGDIIRIDVEGGLRVYLDSGYYMYFPDDVARKLFDAILPKTIKEVLT